MTEPAPTPGRPRDPQVEPRVLQTALMMLVRDGYARLRVDAIARESGVAKSTIYRRWPSLKLLVLDAIASAIGRRDIPRTDDPLADLRWLVTTVHTTLVQSPMAAEIRTIIVDLVRQPEIAAQYRALLIDPMRDRAIEAIDVCQSRGLVRSTASPAVVVDAAVGLVWYRWLIGEPLPTLAEFMTRAIDLINPEPSEVGG